MSLELVVWAAGPAAGSLVGAFSGSLVVDWWRARRNSAPTGEDQPRSPEDDLSETDREVLASAFKAHASSVAQQVTAFADELAGEDVVLRERLRRLEHGGGGRW